MPYFTDALWKISKAIGLKNIVFGKMKTWKMCKFLDMMRTLIENIFKIIRGYQPLKISPKVQKVQNTWKWIDGLPFKIKVYRVTTLKKLIIDKSIYMIIY